MSIWPTNLISLSLNFLIGGDSGNSVFKQSWILFSSSMVDEDGNGWSNFTKRYANALVVCTSFPANLLFSSLNDGTGCCSNF